MDLPARSPTLVIHPATNLPARNNPQVWARNIRTSSLVSSHESSINMYLPTHINHVYINSHEPTRSWHYQASPSPSPNPTNSQNTSQKSPLPKRQTNSKVTILWLSPGGSHLTPSATHFRDIHGVSFEMVEKPRRGGWIG